MIALEDHADALAGQVGALLAIELVHRRLAEPVLAQPSVVEQGQHIEQRRLPCPRRTHDGDKFALANGEPDAAQHPGFGVAGLVTAFNVFQFDHDNILRSCIGCMNWPAIYSIRKACMGSTDAARRAGSQLAIMDAASSTSCHSAERRRSPSCPRHRGCCAWRGRQNMRRPGPDQGRRNASARASLRTRLTTLPRLAPSAMRKPISCSRCATVKAMTP